MPTELAEHLVFLALSEPMKPPALAAASWTQIFIYSLPYTFLLLNGHMESYWDPETFIEKVIEKTKAELEQA